MIGFDLKLANIFLKMSLFKRISIYPASIVDFLQLWDEQVYRKIRPSKGVKVLLFLSM